uniref:FAS1 domain-containing protein n=1 Tax=Mantoniella antarctica TaxID=81844 RepID=A0A7S0SLI9_9CHLO
MAPNRLTLMAMCGAVVVTLTGSIVSAAPMENPTAQKIELPSSTGELKPIVQTLSALPEYSTLVAAVGATDDGGAIVDALAAAGPFTVFAPNNAAFTTFLELNGLTVEKLLASPDLSTILANHAVAGKFTAADVLAMDLPIEVETLGGSKLKIEKVDGDIIVGGQKVVQPDIMATNGVIHGMDGVVMATDPQTSDSTDDAKDELQPIVETLSALPDYSTLVAAVGVAADSEEKKIVDDLVAGGPYTVFAPDNAAFTAFLEKSGMTAEQILASPDLAGILGNHVVAGKFTAADVLAMDLPIEVPTLGGAMLKIDKTTNGDVLVGGQKVVKPDIMATNGVIHGINGVITVPTA